MEHVFVYGSLKRGFGNNVVLHGAEFLQEAVTPPKYTMISLGAFPGVKLEGNTAIHGEVWRVNEEQLERLDRLEGYPSFYNREKIDIPGLSVDPWMYYLDRDYGDEQVIDSGVW